MIWGTDGAATTTGIPTQPTVPAIVKPIVPIKRPLPTVNKAPVVVRPGTVAQ